MKRLRWLTAVLAWMFLVATATTATLSAADATAVGVGRIYHIEGDLLRYVPEEDDWVAVVRDAPFTAGDTLYSGSRGMAELIVPNGAWIRTGNSTQIQFIALDHDLAEMDVASGVARFYNKSTDAVVKVTSPFGYVIAYPATVFDFYVGENTAEAIAIRGKVSFVHTASNARYDISGGSPSILANQNQVSSGEGIADPDWNRWNAIRETFWMTKANVRGRSAEYLPPSLRDEAYALEENGRWERVPYEGANRWFWRPRVVVGWSPFTVGRWTDWHGDQTWVPAEPFGYITHHYGNWVYVRNSWYWAPPVVSMRVGLPLLDIGFFWNPGRVSWIHHGAYVGWVPLAPREMYYSQRNWGGPHAVVVTNANIAQININIRNYAYANHAVVVNQNHFSHVKNYRDVRVANINRTNVIRNYRAAPVINNTVIPNYKADNKRYSFTNLTLKEKPHNTVINRIRHNEAIVKGGRKENAAAVQERVKRIPEGRVNRESRIEQPKGTNHIVPVKEIDRPKSEIKLPQRDVKSGGKPGHQEKPDARPERMGPVKPEQQPGQPARPERAAPARPTQGPGQPAGREITIPVKPVQPEKSPPQRVAPSRPAQPEQVRPERMGPVKPEQQPGQPARPERAAPARPVERAPENTTEPTPVQRQIEKKKEPKSSEKDEDKRRERKVSNDEEKGRKR